EHGAQFQSYQLKSLLCHELVHLKISLHEFHDDKENKIVNLQLYVYSSLVNLPLFFLRHLLILLRLRKATKSNCFFTPCRCFFYTYYNKSQIDSNKKIKTLALPLRKDSITNVFIAYSTIII